jgi:tetratricopeptide (TPR) repeat protein
MSFLRRFPGTAAALCIAGSLTAPGLMAQESTIQKEEREERAVSMSEQVYKRLSAVHELIGEKQNAEALEKLESLEKQRLSPYEQALIYQAYGYVYINKNDTKRAIEYFEKALATDALPNFAQQGMLYSLAGLYASEERYQDAIRTLTTWFKYEPDPPADANILMASSYFELKQYDKALPWVQEAIKKRAADGKEPKESWYQLELAAYFEGNRYNDAAKLLRRMLALWPNQSKYWKTLSGVYTTLEKDSEALALMMLAYEKGHLTEEKELLNLARLNLFLDIPFTAGVILEKEMNNGRIETNQKNLLLLKQCWSNSREYDRTIDVLQRLAEQSEDGEFDIEIAQILVEKTDWDGASAAARRAIDKGGLKKPGNAWLLLGMSLAEGGNYNEAERALREAKKFSENRINERAQGWLDYVNDRRQATGP